MTCPHCRKSMIAATTYPQEARSDGCYTWEKTIYSCNSCGHNGENNGPARKILCGHPEHNR